MAGFSSNLTQTCVVCNVHSIGRTYIKMRVIPTETEFWNWDLFGTMSRYPTLAESLLHHFWLMSVADNYTAALPIHC